MQRFAAKNRPRETVRLTPGFRVDAEIHGSPFRGLEPAVVHVPLTKGLRHAAGHPGLPGRRSLLRRCRVRPTGFLDRKCCINRMRIAPRCSGELECVLAVHP